LNTLGRLTPDTAVGGTPAAEKRFDHGLVGRELSSIENINYDGVCPHSLFHLSARNIQNQATIRCKSGGLVG